MIVYVMFHVAHCCHFEKPLIEFHKFLKGFSHNLFADQELKSDVKFIKFRVINSLCNWLRSLENQQER